MYTCVSIYVALGGLRMGGKRGGTSPKPLEARTTSGRCNKFSWALHVANLNIIARAVAYNILIYILVYCVVCIIYIL